MQTAKQTSIKDLYELSKNLDVLYVEDDQSVRNAVGLGVLPKMFKNFFVAENGSMGLELYIKHRPDIIITDINMPIMNGLEMSFKIRDISEDAHIIITTAYNEIDYFLDSIELSVDGYIIKPFKESNLIKVLYKSATEINNKKLAEKAKKAEIQERIKESTNQAMQAMVDAMFDPVLMIVDGKINYINNSFLEILSSKNLDNLLKSNSLDEYLVIKDGYIKSIDELLSKKETPAKAILNTEAGKRVYLIREKDISNLTEEHTVLIFIFTDVTEIERQKLIIEYQKNKISSYNEILEEIFITKYFKSKKETPTPQAEEAIKASKTPQATLHTEPKGDALLNQDEKELLRKRRDTIVSSTEYIEDMGGELSEEISVLGEIQIDLSNAIEQFAEDRSKNSLELLIKYIKEYASSVNFMIEFRDLATALSSLGAFLENLSEADIEKYNHKIVVYLRNILMDLTEWRTKIFISQEARDIHYLDSSLFSSCLQLQLEVGANINNDEDEDDLGLELF